MIATAAIRRAAGACARGFAGLLMPDVCATCGADDAAADGLCRDCNVRLLALVAAEYCERCGSTLGVNVPARPDGCWGCPTVLPRFQRVIRLGPYTDPVRPLVQSLKYWRRRTIGRRIIAMLAEAVTARQADRAIDVVMPVPMHWRRRLARGRDAARTIAAALAGRLGAPLGGELVRIRHTPPQISLSRTQRIRNVRGAFALTGGRAIAGADVLLVDDVTTTGATANEAARTLLAGGAEHVTLAVIAKAEPPTAYAQHVQA